jgi:ABC-2 type transport system ATP-binding protein
MRAKVSLALALAAEPELLVLDEPTSGIDVLVRREFLESMVDLAGEGRTVLLSSHQIGEVERVASHVALLHQGKLVLAEPLEELKARTYRLLFTLEGEGPLGPPPLGSGIEVIDADDAPMQARWLVHAELRSAIEAARDWPGVASLGVETPSLEEIYIAYMKRRLPMAMTPGVALAVR